MSKTALLDYLQTTADGMRAIRVTRTEAERDLSLGALASVGAAEAIPGPAATARGSRGSRGALNAHDGKGQPDRPSSCACASRHGLGVPRKCGVKQG
jgi:hypothetical protein